MTYIIKGFASHLDEFPQLKFITNRIGWSCFPFHVVDTGEKDDWGNPICIIPDAPGCGAMTLYYFDYE